MDNNYLGWSFPPSFNKYSRSIDIVSDEDSIKQSLYVLLTTVPEERLMELDYGCDIQSILFKPLDLNIKTFLSNNLKSSIAKWEQRIVVDNIEIDGDTVNGILNIKILYSIKENGKNDILEFKYNS